MDTIDIWDVMFSLDKSNFPLSSTYLKEPRGSLNPINSQVKMKPKKEFLEFASKQNLVDLYAFDFELNILFRKLTDFIFFASKNDLSGWYEFDVPEYFSELFRYSEKMEDMIFDSLYLSINDIICEAYSIAPSHLLDGKAPSDEISNDMRIIAELQFAIQYYIENSDLNWRTKAEAFLRSNYLNNFRDADDETLIYLSKTTTENLDCPDFARADISEFNFIEFDEKNEINKKIQKTSDFIWNQYYLKWNLVGDDDRNPFKDKNDISGLRYSNFENLSFLGYLIFDSDSQHLLSSENIGKFCKMMNTFRTDLESIKNQIRYIANLLTKYLLTDVLKFGFNYTLNDRHYLIFIMYHYLHKRIFSSPIYKNRKFKITSDHLMTDPWCVKLKQCNSTLDFTDSPSLLPLICLNVQAIWFSKPKGAANYINDRFKRIIKEQNSYGYWFDHCNSPEFTTVLVLDTLDIKTHNITSPLEVIKLSKSESSVFKLPSKSSSADGNTPYLAYNAESRLLIAGSQKIPLTESQWELFERIIECRRHRVPLQINKKYQEARRYLKSKLKNPKLINKIIQTTRIGRKIRLYEFGPDLNIKDHPDFKLFYVDDLDKRPAKYRKK